MARAHERRAAELGERQSARPSNGLSGFERECFGKIASLGAVLR